MVTIDNIANTSSSLFLRYLERVVFCGFALISESITKSPVLILPFKLSLIFKICSFCIFIRAFYCILANVILLIRLFVSKYTNKYLYNPNIN